jgi:hypothetical protein
MSQSDLRALIKRASRVVEANLAVHKTISSQGLAIRDDGSEFGFQPDGDLTGEEAVLLLREIFAKQKVVRYVLIAPATITLATTPNIEGLNHHPDTTTVVVFSAEDDTGKMLGHRTIDKGSGPPPKLGPLEIVSGRAQYAGSIIGLLPQVGIRQLRQ